MENHQPTILVTGANGYVGGRLTRHLLEQGYHLRAMVRDPARATLPAHPHLELTAGDVLRPESLPPTLAGIRTAYYLIHSLGAGKEFSRLDVNGATAFARAAKTAGVERIIYLGGLGDDDDSLSEHLRSRHETGAALASAGVPVTEFRAGSVIGSGSLAFEILRYLTERLPLMIAPRWVDTRTQPVAIADVLRYLSECLVKPQTAGKIYEIGGADRTTYREMMLTYARLRGLRRRIVAIPVLTPRLSSLWIGLFTPLPPQVARSLADGLRNEILARTQSTRADFPFEPIGLEEMVGQAIANSRRWVFESDDIPNLLDRKILSGGRREIVHSRGYIVEKRIEYTTVSRQALFGEIARIGGANGWPYANALWRLRYLLDRLLEGRSVPRRRDPETLTAGDPVDFWEVERFDPDRRLLLRNRDMRMPGEAWLRFAVRTEGDRNRLTMTAFFQPRGLAGVLYWYALYPLHCLIFGRTLQRIVWRAKRRGESTSLPGKTGNTPEPS